MLPSFTSGRREPVHPGVRGGNMGMSGNKSALPDNKNHPVLPIFIAVFREKGSVFLGYISCDFRVLVRLPWLFKPV